MAIDRSQSPQVVEAPRAEEIGSQLAAVLREASPSRQGIVLAILQDLLQRKRSDDIVVRRFARSEPTDDLWALAVVSTDGTASLLVSGPNRPKAEEESERLLAALHQALKTRGVDFVQAMRDVDSPEPILRAANYHSLAVLDYLVAQRAWHETSHPSSPARQLRFTPYLEFYRVRRQPAKRRGGNHPGGNAQRRLEKLVERTYVGSQDCPQIAKYRSCRQSLDAYRANIHHAADLWLVISDQAGNEIGCVLLTVQSQAILEITYMALVPEYRGRGLGNTIMQHIWQLAERYQCDQITVAVDRENSQGRRLYERWLFEQIFSERVWGRSI